MLYRIIGMGDATGQCEYLNDFRGTIVESDHPLEVGVEVAAKVRVKESTCAWFTGTKVFCDVILEEVK